MGTGDNEPTEPDRFDIVAAKMRATEFDGLTHLADFLRREFADEVAGVERLKEKLKECHDKFREYKMVVDDEPPQLHKDFMTTLRQGGHIDG